MAKAINPTPANEATEVDFSDRTLSWEAGGEIDYYRILISANPEEFEQIQNYWGLTTIVVPEEEMGRFYGNSTFYWRVDTDTETGDVWSFDMVGPGKSQNPTPSDYITGIKIRGDGAISSLSWEAPD